ncbi:MAG: zinc-ribbon domain containing protein [Acutalibacteraceae bacterium]|nr:zinc-ribbon domain containing protein [Acutalibacteraceae bacterium]
MKRICKQCGTEFEITDSEISFYKNKNLALPKRCKQCRNENKQHRELHKMNKIIYKTKSKEVPYYSSVTSSKKVRKTTNKWISYTIIALILILTLIAVGFGVTRLIKNIERNTTVAYLGSSQYQSIQSSSSQYQSTQSSSNTIENKQYSDTRYTFRSQNLLQEHYQKHGLAMGFDNPEEYLEAANKVVNNPEALHKLEQEDGDDVYYLESSNEFVIVSTDRYIRTYFYPNDGIEYYNRQ